MTRHHRFVTEPCLVRTTGVDHFLAEFCLLWRQTPASSIAILSLDLKDPWKHHQDQSPETLSRSLLDIAGNMEIRNPERKVAQLPPLSAAVSVLRNQCELRRGAGLEVIDDK